MLEVKNDQIKPVGNDLVQVLFVSKHKTGAFYLLIYFKYLDWMQLSDSTHKDVASHVHN